MDTDTNLELSEQLSSIRVINKMEEINGNPWVKDPNLDNLIELARMAGVGSMPYVFRDFMDISNQTVLQEVKDDSGEVVGYKPEIHLEVNVFNADTIVRQLFACQVIFYALRHNKEFRIKLNTSQNFSQSGPAKIKTQDGYATFTRTGTQPQMMELVATYADKALEVKKWQQKMIKEFLDKS